MNRHDIEEDFPLSGGEEPNFKYGKITLILMILMIIGVALLTAFSRGLI